MVGLMNSLSLDSFSNRTRLNDKNQYIVLHTVVVSIGQLTDVSTNV